MQDFALTGMLHGRVIRPPAIGSKLLSVDESSVQSIPGVRVARIENFLAVVAGDEWAAIRAARELTAEWSPWEGLPGNDNLEQYVRSRPIAHEDIVITRGDIEAGLMSAAGHLNATYSWPNQSHASLGPSCAIADMRPEGLRSGQPLKGPTVCVSALRNSSEFLRTKCALSTSTALAAMAVMATMTAQPMQWSCRALSAAQSGSSG